VAGGAGPLAEWAEIGQAAPALAATMRRYLREAATFLAPRSVDVADAALPAAWPGGSCPTPASVPSPRSAHKGRYPAGEHAPAAAANRECQVTELEQARLRRPALAHGLHRRPADDRGSGQAAAYQWQAAVDQ
jgi:hypothetical protein